MKNRKSTGARKKCIENATVSDTEKTKKEILEDIGSKIKQLRKNSRGDISIESVAKKLNINRVTLSKIESGNANINAFLLWEIATIFSCKIEDLFPPIPQGFQMSINQKDINEIKKKDEKALGWAEELFGKPSKEK